MRDLAFADDPDSITGQNDARMDSMVNSEKNSRMMREQFPKLPPRGPDKGRNVAKDSAHRGRDQPDSLQAPGSTFFDATGGCALIHSTAERFTSLIWASDIVNGIPDIVSECISPKTANTSAGSVSSWNACSD